ncbi:MAG: DUF3775 domain-containing protein [Rubrimonas sp.]
MQLNIPLDTLAWIMVKAREFDVKEGDSYDGEQHDDDGDVLQDRGDDPTEYELTSWIDDLTDTQAAELVAIVWIGRGDSGPEDFPALVDQARSARGRQKTSKYLLGEPMLADYLAEGLEALGFDPAEVESRV